MGSGGKRNSPYLKGLYMKPASLLVFSQVVDVYCTEQLEICGFIIIYLFRIMMVFRHKVKHIADSIYTTYIHIHIYLSIATIYTHIIFS